MTDQVELPWEGPFSFKEILNFSDVTKEKFSCPGVYVWLRPEKKGGDEDYLAYVGKASGHPTLWERLIQHYKNFLGVNYYIPANFRTNNEEWYPWFGRAKREFTGNMRINETRQEFAEVILDKGKVLEIVRDGFDFADSHKIYVCTIENVKDPNSDVSIALLERNLLYSLKPRDTKWGTRHPPNPVINIIHHNADWIE